MEIVVGLVVILLAGVGIFLKIAFSFGGVKALLSKELKGDRSELSAARKTAKSLAKAAAGELKEANQQVSRESKAYEKRVKEVSDEYSRWLNPGDGQSLTRLGGVKLFEHTVHVGKSVVPLEGISVDTRITDMSAVLILSLPNGMKVSESFDTSWREGETKYSTSSHKDWDILESSTEKKRSYSPDQIIHLAGEINNQAIRHEDFLKRRPEMIELLAAKLEETKANTQDLDSARAALSSLEAGSQTALDSKTAAEALVVAEARYKSIVATKLAK